MSKNTSRKRRSLTERYFSFLERRSVADRLFFHVLLALFIAAAFYSLAQLSQQYTTSLPKHGSDFTEGVVGVPRFVNPILAITRADHDMSTLLFDGLMKIDAAGQLVPDVAESIVVDGSGTRYTVTLRNDEFFHDGAKLTTTDVAFTVDLIQNPELKSPLQGDWDSVSVEIVDEKTIIFSLPEPYSPFMENLTVGILPEHIWRDIAIGQIPFSEYNTSPVGSGPFMVDHISFSDTGLITKYSLTASTYEATAPLLSGLNVVFFDNENDLLAALKKGDVDATASLGGEIITREDLTGFTENKIALPRTFALFYNQNRSAALRDNAVRELLDQSIDKEDLIANVLDGYGIPTHTPIPPTFSTVDLNDVLETEDTVKSDEELLTILTKNGWQQGENGHWQKEIDEATTTLSLTIATVNTPVFLTTAEYIKARWGELGIPVTIEQYDQTTLVQSVIRPRSFTILLFGNDTGRSLDLYPFWHSSQREDPGLNVAQYTNIDTDALLSTMRTSHSTEEKAAALTEFVKILTEEIPATFLYTPTFSYLAREDITTSDFSMLGHPSDRFSNIGVWHRGKETLWPIFIPEQD